MRLVQVALYHQLGKLWYVRLKKDELRLALAVGLLALAPIILLRSAPVVGIYANASALVALVGLALLYELARKLATVTAIIPMSYMVLISLPQSSGFVAAAWLYATILLLSLVYRHMFLQSEKKKRVTLSLQESLKAASQGAIIGLALGGVAYMLLAHTTPSGDASGTLALFVAVAFALIEVLFFQGLMQASAARVMSPWLAAVLTAVLFAGLCAATSGGSLVTSVLTSGCLALIYYMKQSVLLAMCVNICMKVTFATLTMAFAR